MSQTCTENSTIGSLSIQLYLKKKHKKRSVRGLLENMYVMCKAGFSSPLSQMLLFDLNLDGTWDRKVGRGRRRKDTNLLSG